MGIWEWILQNIFNLLGVVGVWIAISSWREETRVRRVGNLIAITANHREVWNKFLVNPELKRVLDPTADVVKQPVTDAEEIFINMVILHCNSVYYALGDKLIVEYEGLRRDISEFLSLPVPKAVWAKTKLLQNHDFVTFVDSALK